MIRQLLQFASKSSVKRAGWRRAARFGAAGAGLLLAGAGAGWAGVALWRRLGMRRQDVRGQVVLITGSSRGLGLALAREFARLGARLVICGRGEESLQAAREELEQGGAEVLAIRCDVTDREQVRRMVAEANGRFGRIDILVTNAGVIQVGPVASQTMKDFQEALDVIFWGAVYPTLTVLPQMVERRRGRIAHIASIGGKVAVPHMLPYDCAKFAVVAFSEGLRAELAKDGVKVTTVVPGLMRTGSHLNATFKGDYRAEYAWFSLGATMPMLSMDARRAARKIAAAVRAGRAEIILTPHAKLLAAFHGLFPGLTAGALGALNRCLPTGTAAERHPGSESRPLEGKSVVTRLGPKAAVRFKQV